MVCYNWCNQFHSPYTDHPASEKRRDFSDQCNLPSSSTVRSTTSAAFCLSGCMTVEILLRFRCSWGRAAWELELCPQCDLVCPSVERDLETVNTLSTDLNFAVTTFFSPLFENLLEVFFFTIRKAFCFVEIPHYSALATCVLTNITAPITR